MHNNTRERERVERKCEKKRHLRRSRGRLEDLDEDKRDVPTGAGERRRARQRKEDPSGGQVLEESVSHESHVYKKGHSHCIIFVLVE